MSYSCLRISLNAAFACRQWVWVKFSARLNNHEWLQWDSPDIRPKSKRADICCTTQQWSQQQDLYPQSQQRHPEPDYQLLRGCHRQGRRHHLWLSNQWWPDDASSNLSCCPDSSWIRICVYTCYQGNSQAHSTAHRGKCKFALTWDYGPCIGMLAPCSCKQSTYYILTVCDCMRWCLHEWSLLQSWKHISRDPGECLLPLPFQKGQSRWWRCAGLYW